MKENNGSFVAFTLGMLTAFGPFMTDFYLPVLPGMTEWFETTPSAMELSLTMGMPVLSSLALDGEHENAGSASAWVGVVSFLAGSLVSPVVMLGRPTVSTGLVILLFSALSCLLTQRLYKKYLSRA